MLPIFTSPLKSPRLNCPLRAIALVNHQGLDGFNAHFLKGDRDRFLRYTPHYRSFNTQRRVTGIDSLLSGEGTSAEQVTVAIPAERLVEPGDRASASHSDSEPAETAAVEAGTSSQRRRVVASSSSKEGEDRMLSRHCQRFMAENLSDSAFGGVKDEALDAPRFAGGASASSPPAVAAVAEVAPTAAAAVGITAVAAAITGISPTPLSLADIAIDDSPPEFSPRVEGRECPAEVVEEGEPGKRPRIKVSPDPSSPPSTEEAP
ncbi:hypothetical protein MRB53_006207 [Persea americana]|uniref:Uncharacterized protein n=1 Tax=Persea americana TaxID=3435 RepID=A0ACC2MGI3_PERAE|nr:hypothetical protein MRB53_006207 [Persea americana]